MIKSEIRARISALAEGDASGAAGTFTNTQLDAFISMAQTKVVNDFMKYAPHLFMGVGTITTVVGQYLYPYPTGLINEPLNIVIRNSAGNDLMFNIQGVMVSTTPGIPTAWMFYGQNIWLHPTPNTIANYSVYGRYYPIELTDTPDPQTGVYPSSTLPLPLQDILCYQAAIIAASTIGDSYGVVGFLMKLMKDASDAYRATVMSVSQPSKAALNQRNKWPWPNRSL